MENEMRRLEEIFENKIMLYKDLSTLLEKEKECLPSGDVEVLWSLSDKKHSIITQIAEQRMKILGILCEAGISHNMNSTTFKLSSLLDLLPHDNTHRLRQYNVPLMKIKDQINFMARENRRYVEEYLEILDDMIGIFTSAGKPAHVYGNNMNRGAKKEKTNLFIHQEV